MLRSQWRDRAGFSPASSHRHADGGRTYRTGRHVHWGPMRADSAICAFPRHADSRLPRPVRGDAVARPSPSTSRSTSAGSTRPARSAPRLGRLDAAWTSPAARARQTAEALGLDATAAAGAGRVRLRRVARTHAGRARRGGPGRRGRVDRGPRRGAPRRRVPAGPARSGGRLARRPRGRRVAIVAVTHAGVIRAALVSALDAPVQAFWRLDVAPLSRTVLHAHDGRWTVRGVNLPA